MKAWHLDLDASGKLAIFEDYKGRGVSYKVATLAHFIDDDRTHERGQLMVMAPKLLETLKGMVSARTGSKHIYEQLAIKLIKELEGEK